MDILGHASFLLQLLLLLITGFFAGLINVTAGGGSMLALPVLILTGLDPITANGTNRISIVVMGATSVYGFYQQKLSEFKVSVRFAMCALPGAIVGALLATQVDNGTLQRIISVILIACVATLLVPMKPSPMLQIRRTRQWLVYPAMFIIGFYGGFIQIGAGFMFMIALQRLLHMNLVKVNIHKALIVLLYTLPALAIFVWMGQVNWMLGTVLAMGTAVGAWLGTRVVVRGGERWVRIVVAVVVVIMAGKMLFDASM